MVSMLRFARASICHSRRTNTTNFGFIYLNTWGSIFIISGEEILIDITTVKNNIKSFQTLKTKTLVWAGLRFSQDIDADVHPYFAIPYNPEGKKLDDINYSRFASHYDREDILVGDELWRIVSNNKFTINDLAEVFEEISSIYKI